MITYIVYTHFWFVSNLGGIIMENEIVKENEIIKCMKSICDYYKKDYEIITKFLKNYSAN